MYGCDKNLTSVIQNLRKDGISYGTEIKDSEKFKTELSQILNLAQTSSRQCVCNNKLYLNFKWCFWLLLLWIWLNV